MPSKEAQVHLQAIADARARVKGLMADVRKHQAALNEIATRSYNEESSGLAGIVADPVFTVLGYSSCEASPIGICVYNERAISLPSQRMEPHTPRGPNALHPQVCHPACAAEACLFCGVSPAGGSFENDGRQLVQSAV